MILTGNAKEAFEKWSENIYDDCGNGQVGKRLFYIKSIDDYKFINTEHYIHNVGNSMLHALIIEWLDSVGIYVSIGRSYISEKFFFEILHARFTYEGKWYKSRQQATEKAIEKAIEIYNEKHK